jgi:ABC-type multidrug transport system fused ATPase/permease subunit
MVKKINHNDFLLLFKLLKIEHRISFVYLLVLMIIGSFFEIIGIGILAPFISILMDSDKIFRNIKFQIFFKFFHIETINEFLLFSLFILFLIYLLKTFFSILLGYFTSVYTTKVTESLGLDLFNGFLKMPYSFYLNNNTSNLIRILNSDISSFGNLIVSITVLIIEILVVVGIIATLIYFEPKVTLVMMGITFIFGYFLNRLSQYKIHFWGERRHYFSSESFKILNQSFSSVKEILIFGRSNYFLNKYKFFNSETYKYVVKYSTIAQIPRAALELFAVLIFIGLVFFNFNDKNGIDNLIPLLGIYAASTFRLIPSINKILSNLQIIDFSKASIDSLNSMSLKIKTCQVNYDEIHPIQFEYLEIVNLCFRYGENGSNVLDSINLRVNSQDFVAFLGVSGSGKSTLIDTILGILKPSSGSIKINGENLNSKNLNSWQNIIGYVPQDINLLDSSIKNNVAFGIEEENIEMTKLNNAIRLSELSDFVDNLPEKLDTIIGEKGARLSGGQRQRLGIARALYNDPQILILDEATSSLDSKTEKTIMDSIQKNCSSKTIIVITHRESTIKNCDNIYRVENGKIYKQL